MKWEQIYSRNTLNAGQALFKEGKIRDDVEISKNAFICTVEGTDRYHVKVSVEEPYRVKVSCSCAVAAEGNRCKHMAAAMMKLDELFANWLEGTGNLKRTKQIETMPVCDIPKVEYGSGESLEDGKVRDSYLIPYNSFDLSSIFDKKFRVTQRRLERGMELVKYHSATVIQEEFRKEKGEGKQCHLVVSVLDGVRQVQVTIITGENRILHMSCTGDQCRGYPKYSSADGNVLCEHQVAGMLMLRSILEKKDNSDMTDKTGRKMIEKFSRITNERQNGQLYGGQVFRLIPYVTLQNHAISVSFRCGTDRDYQVGNVFNLIEAYENRGKFQLFKTNYINFMVDRLDSTSEQALEVIRRSVRSRVIGEKDDSLWQNSAIYLRGTSLDEFFEVYNGKKAIIHGSQNLLFEDGIPHIHMDILPLRDENGRFRGVSVTGKLLRIWKGCDYVYFSQGIRLIRVPISWYSNLQPLYEAAGFDSQDVSFVIGRHRMGEFYRKILPAMSEVIEIDDYAYDTAKDFIPPEGKAIFYLDCNEDFLICGAKVQYGSYEGELVDRDDSIGFYRDTYWEQPAFDAVTGWFPEYNREEKVSLRDRNDHGTYTFLRNGVNELQMLGEVQASAEFRKLKLRRGFRPQMGISVESGLLTLSLQPDGISKEELAEILGSYKKKKDFHVLRNGEFLDLSDTVDVVSEFLDAADVSIGDFVNGKMHLPAYRMLYLDEMQKKHEDIICARDETFLRLLDRFSKMRSVVRKPPESLAPILREYQTDGYVWMEQMLGSGFCGILADDMGLGKTLQMITVILSDKEQGRSGTMPSLITCPASLVYNWIREFRRFAPSLSVVPVAGGAQERKRIIREFEKADVLITSYDLMKRDIDQYEGITFWIHVLDEAQYIKNHGSSAAKAVKIVRAEHRMALTGTPIENRLSELWSIFDFLMPGFLYSYSKFRDIYETPIVKYGDERVMERLRRMVSPFILRRLKKDVLRDLPEKTEETRYITLNSNQQKLYSAQAEHIRYMLHEGAKDTDEKQRFKIMAELMRLRQICCDPGLVYENYTYGSSKREELLRLIREAVEGGHKVLVFSQFTTMMAIIEQDLQKEKIPFYHLSGSTPKEERLRLADAFNSDATPVFMISLKAGGTGLNLVGADIVIHFEPWWNVAAMNQATDRAHRIGQVHPVTVFRLIARNTIEERVQELQESKRELAEGILNGENGAFNRLTREELLDLISDDGTAPDEGL